jgi:hypothetical protein
VQLRSVLRSGIVANVFQTKMNIVKITNGFPNPGGPGIRLAGVVTKGSLEKGDHILLDNGGKIPIVDVEFDRETFPGVTHVLLAVSRTHDVIWHKHFGREFEVEKHNSK